MCNLFNYLFGSERERGLRNMIVIFKYIKCCCKRQVNNLSFTSTVDSTESNGLFNSGETLKENNFVTARITRYWKRLLREVVETPSSLKPLKSKVDKWSFGKTKV